MIGWLRGVVRQVQSPPVLIDVGGVGYEVEVSQRLLEKLPAVGEICELYTEDIHKDDSRTLYGFPNRTEREFFRMLTGISGVGPRTALAILSTLGIDGLQQAVATGDQKALVRVPGIGAKTARRILVDLSDSLQVLLDSLDSGGAATQGSDDVRSALEALGYSRSEAVQMLRVARQGVDGEMDSAELLRRALQSAKQGDS